MGGLRGKDTGGSNELPLDSTLEGQFTDAENSFLHLDRTVAMP